VCEPADMRSLRAHYPADLDGQRSGLPHVLHVPARKLLGNA